MSTLGFQDVRLYTAGGPYVDEERFVVAGEIPAFNTQPDVLIWGERLFRFACVMDTHLVYVEAFSVTLAMPDATHDTERAVLIERMDEAFAHQSLMAMRHSQESADAAKMVWDSCMAVTRFDRPELEPDV